MEIFHFCGDGALSYLQIDHKFLLLNTGVALIFAIQVKVLIKIITIFKT